LTGNELLRYARHGCQFGGESPLWAWQWKPLAEWKGARCKTVSEWSLHTGGRLWEKAARTTNASFSSSRDWL